MAEPWMTEEAFEALVAARRERDAAEACCRGSNPACAGGCLEERSARERERDLVAARDECSRLRNRLAETEAALRAVVAAFDQFGEALANYQDEGTAEASAHLVRSYDERLAALALPAVRRLMEKIA